MFLMCKYYPSIDKTTLTCYGQEDAWYAWYLFCLMLKSLPGCTVTVKMICDVGEDYQATFRTQAKEYGMPPAE